MKKHDKNSMTAMIATVIFHAAVILLLVLSCLHYEDIPANETIASQDITFFGGEYVMLGDSPELPDDGDMTPAAASDANPESTGDDIDDTGLAGVSATPVVTSDEESPMKVEQETKQAGPTQEEIAEQERIKRRQEAERRTNSKVRNAFSNTGGKGKGKQGSPDGNSSSGARTGAPGVSGLSAGYSLDRWGSPSSPVEGKIVIRVRVDSRGNVTEARYSSGSGTAASNMDVRRSCEQASLQSSFSVPLGTVDEAIGYITWIFQ